MKQKTERLLKRGAAFLLALMLFVPGAWLRPEQAYGKYHDTNLNTFVHPMPETSEGTAGEMMQIKMRIGYYNDTHGFYAPQTDYITDVHVRLSNDETVLLGMVEAGLGVFISTDYPQIHSDQIAILPLRQDRLLRYVYLATCEGRSYSPHAQSLIAYSLQQAPSLIPEHHLP